MSGFLYYICTYVYDVVVIVLPTSPLHNIKVKNLEFWFLFLRTFTYGPPNLIMWNTMPQVHLFCQKMYPLKSTTTGHCPFNEKKYSESM